VRKVFKKLDESLAEMQRFSDDNNPHDFVNQDALFHRAIIYYANNERIISTYNDIRFRFERITLRVLTDYGRMASTINEHRKICEMMRAGKPWEAYLAIQEHLQKTQIIMERKTVEEK
jgi:DNA-binding GntR family transcriptional regulator